MEGRVRIDDVGRLHQEAREVLDRLDELARARAVSHGDDVPQDLQLIERAARLALSAAAAGLGECREAIPYEPLYPVIENGTFKWCCTHNPRHCAS